MKKALLLILLLILANHVEAQDKDPAIKIGEKFRLHSKVLNEDRPYWVYLPESYNSKNQSPEAYPVLYLLDGDALFDSALRAGVITEAERCQAREAAAARRDVIQVDAFGAAEYQALRR